MIYIKDIPENFKLLIDSQDCEAISNYLGFKKPKYGCYFVELLEGDYGTIYYYSGLVPVIWQKAIKLQ